MACFFLTQVLIEQLAVRQEDSENEVRGPPAAKAFDAEGNFTKVRPFISMLEEIPLHHSLLFWKGSFFKRLHEQRGSRTSLLCVMCMS